MRLNWKALLVITAAALLLAANSALAQPGRTRSEVTMLINERGIVEVVDRWTGLNQSSGTFDYFSAAKEVGTVPVDVVDHGFTVTFATRSYLRFEDGAYWFVTPDFYYDGGPLDVALTLTYPDNMVLGECRPLPAYTGDGVVRWEITGAAHEVVLAQFALNGPFTSVQAPPEAWELDQALINRLHPSELPENPSEVLAEFELLVAMARAGGAADEDFLRVLDKMTAKFYYVLSIYGLLNERNAPGGSAAGEGSASAPELTEEERRRNEKVHGYW